MNQTTDVEPNVTTEQGLPAIAEEGQSMGVHYFLCANWSIWSMAYWKTECHSM